MSESGAGATTRRLGCAVALLCLPGLALAGPPFITDDPDTVDDGAWEVNLAAQGAWTRRERDGTASHADINYGLMADLQLHAQPALVYAHPSDAQGHYGLGDTELGLKWRFVHADGARPEITVYPLLELPTGDDRRGLGSGRAQVLLPVWLGWSSGAWTAYGGGGYRFNPGTGHRDFIHLGWEAQRQLTESLYLGAELYHDTPDAVGGASASGFNVGGQWDVTAHVRLLFSAGHSLGGVATTTSYVGTQLAF